MSDTLLPACTALLVSADATWLQDWSQRLAGAAKLEEDDQHCCRLSIGTAESAEDLFKLAVEDGTLQCVVLDAETLGDVQGAAATLRSLRSEIDVFLAIGADESLKLTGVELLDRHEPRAEMLWRRLHSAITRRARTPFADTLREYVEGARDAWHTPGHSSGDGLSDSPWVADFYRLMGGHVFNADLSVSVQELDSLLEPSHVIHQAQQLAARAFGARHTFFVTGGTSMANKVIVQHVLGDGGKMLVDQACHKSVHHAAVLFGADPIYLPASVNTDFGLYGPVPKQQIFDAIDQHADARLLVLTSCTYDGFYYDLKPIIEKAHAQGMRVLVDEAWYAHGYFHPALRPCALESGADFVTQSTHKMLSAFSQASMIHIGDADFDEARFREHLNMHTSTSPQYGLIASLDVARKQMSLEGYSRLTRSLEFADQIRAGVAQTGVFRVLELTDMLPEDLAGDQIRLDPLKLSIDVSAAPRGARHLQKLLYERYAIQVEKVTHNTISVLVTLGTTHSKVLRLVNALRELAQEQAPNRERVVNPPLLPKLARMAMNPRQAYFNDSEYLPLVDEQHQLNNSLLGRVCADQVVPYPPGIPVLVPGQEITREILGFLLDLQHNELGIEIHGVVREDGMQLVRVVR